MPAECQPTALFNPDLFDRQYINLAVPDYGGPEPSWRGIILAAIAAAIIFVVLFVLGLLIP
jgi:hypothetical protein